MHNDVDPNNFARCCNHANSHHASHLMSRLDHCKRNSEVLFLSKLHTNMKQRNAIIEMENISEVKKKKSYIAHVSLGLHKCLRDADKSTKICCRCLHF